MILDDLCSIMLISFLSYIETEAKGTPDILDFAEVRRRLQTALTDLVPPAHAGTLCFWGEESTYDHVEVDYGQGVRLKTKGDSPFLGESQRIQRLIKSGQF